jgi:hypothetical protein
MTAPTTIADVLTMARLASPAYTDEEMATAETRLAAKAADRIVTGAVTFDNATHHLYWRPAPRSGTHPGPEDGDDGIHRAGADLRALCHLVISQPDALSAMSTFIGDRILEPAGARVLACVLHLAGREGSARFWWQYAAGADDVAASYCL